MSQMMINDSRQMMRARPHIGPGSCPTHTAHVLRPCKPDGLPILSRRQVTCHNTNDFRQSFQGPEPGRYNSGDDQGAASSQGEQGSYAVIGAELSPYAQERLAEAEDGDEQGAGAALLQTLALVDEESQRWPSITRTADGQLALYPGFLLRLIEVLPAEFIIANNFQRFFQLAVAVGYMAAAVMAAQWALAANYNLGIALVVTWARDKLSLGRLAVICSLAWFGNLWLYWVLFVGARIDDVMKKIAPPIRWFCWLAFAGWLAYVFLSPVWHHPTPWFTFAPGNNPFHGANLMRA